MCGIVGLISKASNGFTVDERDSFKDMLILDQVRGMDGTGVFGVYHNRQCAVAKIGTNASNFVEMEAFKKFESNIYSKFWAIFGHNRKATQGVISSKNSHPFVQNNIVLIHNGTLHNHKVLANTDVDSEAIAVALNNGEPEEVLARVHGAYALVWYDKRNKTISIARNIDRPLFVGETNGSWIFCSEPSILVAAASRNGIKVKDIESIEVGTIFKFKNGASYEYTKIQPKTYGYPTSRYVSHEDEEVLACGPFADCSKPQAPALTTTTPLLPVNKGRLHIPTKPNTTPPWKEKQAEIRETVDKLLKPVGSNTIPKVNSQICYVAEKIIPTSRASTDGKTVRKGWEVHGKINRDGVNVDVIGFCSWPDNVEHLERDLNRSRDERGNRWVSGEVVESGANLNGPWVRCEDITGEVFIQVWNTKTLPQTIWREVVATHVCDKCAKPILSASADVTSVNYSGYGRIYKLTCGDCVDKSFSTKGKDNDKTDTSAIQDGQQQLPLTSKTIH